MLFNKRKWNFPNLYNRAKEIIAANYLSKDKNHEVMYEETIDAIRNKNRNNN